MMVFWKVVLTLMFLPLAVLYHLARIIFGKERAQKWFYDIIVAISARVLALNIPTLEKDQPFSVFSDNFMKAMGKMPFEEIAVSVQTNEIFQLNITRCQFVEVFQFLKMPELVKALCEGDVVFCEKYQPLIQFQREHKISDGDDFCDHTYFHHPNIS